MSWNETDCPKCGVRLKTSVRGMGVPGGKEREEGFCPVCNELVISEMTDGFVYVELAPTCATRIMNPLTGRPLEKTPDGRSLADVTFSSEERAQKFVSLFWPSAVITKEGPVS